MATLGPMTGWSSMSMCGVKGFSGHDPLQLTGVVEVGQDEASPGDEELHPREALGVRLNPLTQRAHQHRGDLQGGAHGRWQSSGAVRGISFVVSESEDVGSPVDGAAAEQRPVDRWSPSSRC